MAIKDFGHGQLIWREMDYRSTPRQRLLYIVYGGCYIDIDIGKMYVYNKKLRARGQFCWEFLQFVIINGA